MLQALLQRSKQQPIVFWSEHSTVRKNVTDSGKKSYWQLNSYFHYIIFIWPQYLITSEKKTLRSNLNWIRWVFFYLKFDYILGIRGGSVRFCSKLTKKNFLRLKREWNSTINVRPKGIQKDPKRSKKFLGKKNYSAIFIWAMILKFTKIPFILKNSSQRRMSLSSYQYFWSLINDQGSLMLDIFGDFLFLITYYFHPACSR